MRRVVADLQQPLTAYARRQLGSEADSATDVVQETFARLWASNVVGDDAGVRPFCFRVCRNVCFDLLRRSGRERNVRQNSNVREFTDPNRRLDARGDLRTFFEVFESLPERQREVLRLKLQHDLSYAEIGHALGLSVANVGWLLHVGLKTVRAHFPKAARPAGKREAS